MREIHVPLEELNTKDKIHDYFSEVLKTPNWYGRNLDALYDELTSVCEQTVIKCYGRKELFSVDAQGVWDVLKDASEENSCLKVEILEGSFKQV